jgi:thiamine-phosphate pyrophosphorylase
LRGKIAMDTHWLLRIFDANCNRAREGLRVAEEIARFVLGDESISAELKDIRHKTCELVEKLTPDEPAVAGREVRTDVGRESFSKSEGVRVDLIDIARVNLGRSEEALRVLEEFSKLRDKSKARGFKSLRFKVYELEKVIVQKLGNANEED